MMPHVSTFSLPRCLLLLAAGLACVPVLGAQPFDPERIRFVSYTTDDGLPHATVTSMTRDRRGFLWIGTLDGLARFDGHSFETFRPDPARPGTLSDGFIHVVVNAPDGGLWVGTRGGGINYFDSETETFRAYRALPTPYVNGLQVRADGRVWVFTTGGTCLLDPVSAVCQRVVWEGPGAPPPEATIQASLIRHDGALWVAVSDALYRATLVHAPSKGAVEVALAPVALPAEAAPVLTLSETVEGDVWVGTNGQGLVRLDASGTLVRHYRVGAPAPFGVGDGETVAWFEHGGWIWARDGRLLLIDPHTGAVQPVPYAPERTGTLERYRPTTGYRDPDGGIWIGTWGGGLKRLVPPPPFALLNERQGLAADFVLSVTEDEQGAIWVGTSEGLDKLDSLGARPQRVMGRDRSTCQGSIWALYAQAQAVWVGTRQSGVCRVDTQTLRAEAVGTADLSSVDVQAVWMDRRGWLWIGHGEAGLQVIEDPDAWRRGLPARVHTFPEFAGAAVKRVYEDAKGDVWIGTKRQGAFRLRVKGWPTGAPPDIAATSLPIGPTGSPHSDVRAFWEAPDSTVWMATYGGGIGAWHPGRGARHIGRAEGLPNTFTYGIIPDAQGHLWIPTNSGLARYDLATGVVRTFDRRDGIQDDEFNTGAWHAGASGWLYAGGVSGLSAWRPERIEPPQPLPPLYLTELRIFDTPAVLEAPLHLLQSITLPHDQNFLTFTYTAPALAQADRVRYRYWLEGEDPVPVEAAKRQFASYTNLAPGRYTFTVEAFHLDAPTEVQQTRLAVVILPPWWRTWWFYTLAFGTALAGLVATVRWASTRTLRAQVQMLETERRVQAERQRISRDLHDHVGAQLASLASGLELAEAYARHDRASERDATLRSLQAEARHTIAQLRGTIWALSDEPVPLRRFAEHVVRYARAQARYTPGLNVEETRDVDDRILGPVQALHLYRIVQEAIQNTLKHAGASRLHVGVTTQGDLLSVEVGDDGQYKGEAPGNGLRNMQQRAEEIGARFALDAHSGTTVRIVLALPELPSEAQAISPKAS